MKNLRVGCEKKPFKTFRQKSLPPVFVASTNSKHNARIDLPWMDAKWDLYANGYKRAVELLLSAPRSEFEKNTLVFPILFLFHQYIELQLKTIIYVADRSKSLRNHHDISTLWIDCKNIFKARQLPISLDNIRRIDQLIEDWDFDKKGMAFRFPVTLTSTSSLPSSAKVINLEYFRDDVIELSQLLGQAYDLFDVGEDLRREFSEF